MLIKEGSILRLHEKGLHRIDNIYIDCVGGQTYDVWVEITDLDTNKQDKMPAFIILGLINNCQLYPQEQEESMKKYHESVNKKIEAVYTSVWDNGLELEGKCIYHPSIKTVTDFGDSGCNVEDGTLVDEYVTLPDGTVLREKDGVTFEY